MDPFPIFFKASSHRSGSCRGHPGLHGNREPEGRRFTQDNPTGSGSEGARPQPLLLLGSDEGSGDASGP